MPKIKSDGIKKTKTIHSFFPLVSKSKEYRLPVLKFTKQRSFYTKELEAALLKSTENTAAEQAVDVSIDSHFRIAVNAEFMNKINACFLFTLLLVD